MRYSDNITCKLCHKPMRGKGLEVDAAGREFIACEYCGARHEALRHQLKPGGRVQIVSGDLIGSPSGSPSG